jgi:hypothetical protein
VPFSNQDKGHVGEWAEVAAFSYTAARGDNRGRPWLSRSHIRSTTIGRIPENLFASTLARIYLIPRTIAVSSGVSTPQRCERTRYTRHHFDLGLIKADICNKTDSGVEGIYRFGFRYCLVTWRRERFIRRAVDTPLQDEPLLRGYDDVWTTSSLQS